MSNDVFAGGTTTVRLMEDATNQPRFLNFVPCETNVVSCGSKNRLIAAYANSLVQEMNSSSAAKAVSQVLDGQVQELESLQAPDFRALLAKNNFQRR